MRLCLLAVISTGAAHVLPVGTAIERAASAAEILAAAARVPAPGPDFASPHLAQDVHQVKRQQLASNGLAQLQRLLIGSAMSAERHEALRSPMFEHLVQCAASPSSARDDATGDAKPNQQSARAVLTSLVSLSALCAADAVDCAQHERGKPWEPLSPSVSSASRRLVDRVETLSDHLSRSDAVAARWATRRLHGRAVATPRLDARHAGLPFDLAPGLVALPPPLDDGDGPAAPHERPALSLVPSVATLVPALTASALRDRVPFVQSVLMTADGRRVRERRHTAWLAEEGIGALAYSGKLMSPSALDACELVARVRDGLASDLGERFDCLLANLYPAGGSAACAWHQDPEHGDEIDVGAMWARPTYVVSCGETRRFAFRRCREHSARGDADGERHFATPLFSGDVVIMHSDCNDNWEHSVLAGQGEGNQGARVSLVFKRALASRDGRRGHTLQGQGRRARSHQSAAAGGSASAVSTPRPSYKPSRTKSKRKARAQRA